MPSVPNIEYPPLPQSALPKLYPPKKQRNRKREKMLKGRPKVVEKVLNCWIIYVLELEDGCWYVGQTTTRAFAKRMHHHWFHPSKGAMWTRAHKPVRVRSIDTYNRSLTKDRVEALENAKTLLYAQRYGFESVRGGGYCQREPHWPII